MFVVWIVGTPRRGDLMDVVGTRMAALITTRGGLEHLVNYLALLANPSVLRRRVRGDPIASLHLHRALLVRVDPP